MKLTILGTGTFFVSKDRSASAYLLGADNKKILVDCGPGTLVRLSQLGLKPWDIDYVFITHFHPDHTSDLFPFFMNIRLADLFPGEKPTKYPTIFGPKGIYKFLYRMSKISQLHAFDNYDKIKFEGVEKVQEIGHIKVEAFKVKHNAFKFFANAYAYLFHFENKKVSFSGDTIRCTGIERACKDADLFLCDSSYPIGQPAIAHMDTKDIGEICQKSKVKKVILCHQYPQYDNYDMASEVKEFFSGEVVRGKDLMEFEI